MGIGHKATGATWEGGLFHRSASQETCLLPSFALVRVQANGSGG